MRRIIGLLTCCALVATACSSSGDTADTAPPKATTGTADSSAPSNSKASSTTAAGPTTTVAPKSPFVELPAPDGYRRTTPGGEFVGVLAATDSLPRIAVGTELRLDGAQVPSVWTWDAGVPATATPLGTASKPTALHFGASGASYVIGHNKSGPVLWSSPDRITWAEQQIEIAGIDWTGATTLGVVEVGSDVVIFASDSTQVFSVRLTAGITAEPPAKIADLGSGGWRISGVATNGSTIVLIGSSGDFVSPDGGATWTPIAIQSSGADTSWTTNVFWFTDRFVVVGGALNSGSPDIETWSSPDGVTWALEARTFPDLAQSVGGPIGGANEPSASDGGSLWMMRTLSGPDGFDLAVSVRDPSGAWTDTIVASDAARDQFQAFDNIAGFAASANEVVVLIAPETPAQAGRSVTRIVGGEVLEPETLVPEGTLYSDAHAFGVGSDIAITFDGAVNLTPELGSVEQTTATTTDRATWSLTSTDHVVFDGANIGFDTAIASDGATAMQSSIEGVVVRGPGAADWQPTGQFGLPARLAKLWLVDNKGVVTTSPDGVTWSAPITTKGSSHCQLPDGRLIGHRFSSSTAAWEAFIATPETGAVDVIPNVVSKQSCVETSAGVLINVDGQYQLTVDGINFAPPATELPSDYWSSVAYNASGGIALASSSTLSYSADGTAWTSLRYPRFLDQLLSVSAVENGWVIVGDSPIGVTVLHLPNP